MHTYIHTYLHTICVCMDTYMHTCMHKYIHIQKYTYIHAYIHVRIHSQWRIQGWQIRPWPPSKLAMKFGPPFGGRQSNDSIANLSKCKDFGPPVSMSATDLAPLWKNTTLKHEKVDN